MADLTPNWVDDESICPCGAAAGPDFRYGLCDRHARAMPPEALLRFGATMGRLLKEASGLAHELATLRERTVKVEEFKALSQRLSGLHEKIAARLPSGGLLRCPTCAATMPIRDGDVARYLAKGWPMHCKATMRWETPR